ncbi:MAG: hypothetical protein ACR9NN_20625 [Nostochopsis sp.]
MPNTATFFIGTLRVFNKPQDRRAIAGLIYILSVNWSLVVNRLNTWWWFTKNILLARKLHYPL